MKRDHSTWEGMAVFSLAVEKKELIDSIIIEHCPVQGQKPLHHYINPDVNSANTL